MDLIKPILAVAMSLAAAIAQADALSDALQDSARPQTDIERDATSKPAIVLRFFGLPEGAVVLDLFAGSGYYSEIVGKVIGPHGKVILHNNAAYLNFAGEALRERLHNDRLANVVRYDREIDAIDLADDSVDVVLMVKTYHDLYYKTEGWDLDPDAFFEMVHRVLKPGGVLAIVDHIAVTDSGSDAAQELHRIDPEFAKADIESRGFELVGVLDALENSADPLDISVFDDEIRRKTSRFVYKFVEPGS